MFDLIEQALEHQHQRRRDALMDLEVDLAQEEPPSFVLDLLLTVGEIALNAATAGIAGTVARRLVSDTARMAQDAVKKAVESSAKEGVVRAAGLLAVAGPLSPGSFLRVQRDALASADYAAIDAFIKHRFRFEQSAEGLAQAEELYCALRASEEDAYRQQRDETTRQWCVYQARAELGSVDQGTDMTDALGGNVWPDWMASGPSLRGVLQIEVDSSDPRKPVTVRSARLKGVPEKVRAAFADTPLQDARIPLEVHGAVPNPAAPGRRGYIRIGQGETGTTWCDMSDDGGLRYLYQRAGGRIAPGNTNGELADRQIDGARAVLDHDLLPFRLAKLGVTIDG